MTYGVKLSDGRNVSSDDLIDYIFKSPNKALPVIGLVVDYEQRVYFYKVLLAAVELKAPTQYSKVYRKRESVNSVAEEVFHGLTLGLFEEW